MDLDPATYRLTHAGNSIASNDGGMVRNDITVMTGSETTNAHEMTCQPPGVREGRSLLLKQKQQAKTNIPAIAARATVRNTGSNC